MRVAVIDCGTNSVRLLVTGDGVTDVERSLDITRLGEGVDGAGRLGGDPMRRTVDAIARFARRATALGAQRLEIAATSAVRDAANRDEFLRAVTDATGVAPVVLSGNDEARAGFDGARSDLDGGPFVVVDVGGGSTEFIRGADGAERWISVQLGSVRHTERHIANDPPRDDEIASLRKDARTTVDDALAAIGAQPAQLVGLAGTFTTVAAVALDLDGYDRGAIHHAVLARADVADVRARLCAMTNEQRRALPAMPRGREDVVVAGVVILEEIMDAFRAPTVLVSERDILDGRALRLLAGR